MIRDAPADDGGARHLVPGLALPDLALPSTQGQAVNLGTRRGRAVVYIYPWTGRPGYSNPPGWDDIPGAHGSTPETVGFREAYSAFRDHGVEVFGLSTQDEDHQIELAKRLDLTFAILSDAGFEFQRALGLPTFAAGSQTFLRRLTLYVQDGRVGGIFYPVHPPESHAQDVLDWLQRRVSETEQ